jgi:hypothetical protein
MSSEASRILAIIFSVGAFLGFGIWSERRHALFQRRETTFRSLLPDETKARLEQQDVDDWWERQY